jgi:hypothetical protein
VNRWLFRPGFQPICQVSGPFDEERKTRLPAQCCGLPADQIYKCEQIAPPGEHRCRVNDHTILHERMGNGYSCGAVEVWLAERGGLHGWITARITSYTTVGA